MSSLHLQPIAHQSPKLLGSKRMQMALDILAAPQAKLEQLVLQVIEDNPLFEISPLQNVDSIPSQANKEVNEPKELDFSSDHLKDIEDLGENFCEVFWESYSPIEITNERDPNSCETWVERLPHQPKYCESIAQELVEVCADPQTRQDALVLAGYANEFGFIDSPLEQISQSTNLSIKRLKQAQNVLQSLEPIGFASANLQQALLYQLDKMPAEKTALAKKAIEFHWDDLLHRRMTKLSSSLRITPQEVQVKVLNIIAKLNYHCCRAQNTQVDEQSIDLIFEYNNGAWFINLTNPLSERLSLNQEYVRLLREGSGEFRSYLKSKLAQCRWIMRSLQERDQNILKIAHAIAKRQSSYLNAQGPLQPMHLRDLAEACEIHESTVARAIQGKLAQTPRGLVSLRSLLNYGLSQNQNQASPGMCSSNAVCERIREWIGHEDPKHPLSDDQIRQKLMELNINCARRTIAKYRQLLKIPSSSKRKRYD